MRNPNLELPEQQKTVAPTVTQPKVQQNKSTVKPNLPELPKQGSTRKAQYATKVETIPYNANTNPYAAQVYQLGMQIGKYGANDKLANQFRSAYLNYQNTQTNPYSQYYNPYSKATNYKAIEGLRSYGYDPDQMTDDQIRMLTVGKRTTATGYDAAAPLTSGKSTPEQDLAYWAQEYLQAQDTTLKAEKELDDLGKDIEYYVSKGYSDKQIYDAVSSKYSTLNSMMSKKAEGNAVLLNRAVNFNGDDTIYGMIWSARNGGSVGDYGLDAAAYYSKIGNTYKPDEAYTRRHDATNKDTYNPYADGTTLSLGDKYRVINFSREWLQEHRLELDEDDILKIDDAITNSEKAEAEIAQLNEYIAKQLEGKTPQQQVEVYKKLADRLSDDKNDWLNEQGYSTLSKMESKRTSGNPLALGYGVDFNLKDTINDLRARGEAINGEIKTEEAQAEADKRMANARKKFKNDDEGFLKEVDSIIADLQKDEKYEGADIDTIVSGIQNEVHGARLKVDKTAQTKARVEEIRASGDTLGERMASGNYSEAQLKEKTKQYLRGEDVGEDWEALMGRTFRSLLFATDNTDYGQLNAALNGLDYSTGVKLIGGAVQELADAGDATKGDVIDRIMRGTGVTSLAAAMDQQNWKNVLGEDAYKALTRVKDAFDNGVITSDQYVDYIYDLALTVDEAIQKETDPAEYLQNSMFGDFDYQRLDPVIVEQRQQREELMAELNKQEKASIAQVIQTAENNIAIGEETDQDLAIVQAYKSMDLGTAFRSAPALGREYDFQKLDITERVHEDMTTKLIQAFGRDAVNEWVKDSPTGYTGKLLDSNASQIAEIAMEYFADDYKKAAMCGMSIEEYYEVFPTRKPDEAKMQEIIAGAVNTYNRNWGQVWLDVDNIIRDNEQAATMPMYIPRARSLEDVWDAASAIGDSRDKYISEVYSSEAGEADAAALAAAEKTAAAPEAKENKIPVWTAAYLAGKLGVLSFEQGPLKAFSGFVTYMADEELEAYNRAHYLNDPVAYRQKLEETIDNGIADPQLAAWYKEMLNTYDGDVFNIQMNFLDQGVQDVMYSIQENARQTQEYINENASPLMAGAINRTSNLIMNGMNLGFTALLTSVGVDPMTATTLIYGVPEAGEMMERLNSAGVDTNSSRAAGLITALGVGALEKVMNFDVYIENFGRKAFDAAASKVGLKALAQHIKPGSLLARAGKAVVRAGTVTGGGESLQEGAEAIFNWLVESSAETWNGYGFTFDERWRENLENANIPESMKEGYIQGIGLGAIANLGGRFLGFVSGVAQNRRSIAGPVTSINADSQLFEEARAEAEEQAPESEKMAMDIIENKVEPTDENIAALLDQYAKDLSDPRVVRMFEDHAAMAEAQEQVASDILGNPDNAYMKGMQTYADGVKNAQTEVDNLKAKLEQEQQAIETNGQTLMDLQAFVQADPANKEKAQRYTDYLAESRNVIEQHDATLEQYGKAQQALEEAQRDYNNASVAYTDGVYLAAYQMAKTKRTRIIQAEAVAERLEKEADALYQKTVTKATDALKSANDALKEAKIAPLDRAQQRAAIAKAEKNITRAEKKVDTALDSPKLALAQAKADFARLTVKQMSAHHISMGEAAAYVQERDRLRSVIAELEGVVRNGQIGNVATDADWSIMAGINMMASNPRGTTGYVRGQNLVNMAAAENRFHNLPADATSEQIAQARTEMEEAQRIYKESVANGDQAVDQMGEQTTESSTTEVPTTEGMAQSPTTEARQAQAKAGTQQYHSADTQGFAKAAEETDENAKKRPVKVKGVASPVKTIEKLAKDLNVGLYRSKTKTATGYYNTWARSVTQSSKQAANLAIGMHEIGHHIQNVTKWQLPESVLDNFQFADEAVMNDPEQHAAEAFAEFFAKYMENQQKAVNLVGEDVVRSFEGALDKNGMLKSVKLAQAKVSGYYTASTGERISAQVVNRSDTKKKKAADRMRSFMSGMIDHAYAGKVVDDLVRQQREGNTNEDWTVEDALHYRVYHKRLGDVCLTHAMVDSKGNKIRESMADMLAEHGIKAENADEFMYYRLAKHALDRNVQGKRVFGESDNITDEDLLQFVADHNHLYSEANEAFTEWWQDFTQAWLVDTGLLSQQDMDYWNEMYHNYIPTYRDVSGNSIDAGYTNQRGKRSNSWAYKAAGTSDLDIINPWDGIIELTNSIVHRAADNEVGQVFDKMYTEYKGLGIFAEKVSEVKYEPSALKQQVRAALDQVGAEQAPEVQTSTFTGNTREIGAPYYMTLEETEERTYPFNGEIEEMLMPTGRPVPNKSTGGRLVVAREDGTVVTYDFNQGDMLLYSALTSQGPEAKNALLRGVSAINRKFSAFTTGSNPLFGARNVVRDVQQAVTQGTFATNEVTGTVKWLATAVDYMRNSETMDEYVNLGGGGWSYANTASAKGRVEARRNILKGYHGNTIGETARFVKDKAFAYVTLEGLNEMLETTTRFMEYSKGQYDRSDWVGRRKAFLGAQDVTVDFGRYGLSGSYTLLKSIIPFFGPTVQGVAQAGKTIHDAFSSDVAAADKSRAWKQIGKKALNSGIRAAIQAAIIHAFCSDDEKKGYAEISQDIRTGHLILPGRWFGIKEKPWVRIPIGQSIIDRGFYAGFQKTIMDGALDDVSLNLMDAACRILQDASPIDVFQFGDVNKWMNGVMSSTIAAIPWALATNQTYYGGQIVPKSLQGEYFTEQYYSTTPQLFISMSRGIDELNRLTGLDVQISPIELQYIAKQYTGYFGQVLIPMLSPDRATGQWTFGNAWYNVVHGAESSWTIDNLTNNDISDAYYDYEAQLEWLKDWDPKKSYVPGLCDPNADPEDMKTDATTLYKEYNNYYRKKVKDLTAEINEINNDDSMTASERAMAVREPERQRLDLMAEFNGKCADFYNQYGRQNLFERYLNNLFK